MNTLFRFSTLILLTLAVSISIAGNAQMMQNTAQNLIKINENIIHQLIEDQQADGKIALTAKVVEQAGKRQILIDAVAREGNPLSAMSFDKQDYITFVHYGSIPQKESFPLSVDNSTQDTAVSIAKKQHLDKMLNAHPQLQMKELKGKALGQLPVFIPEGGGAVLLYW